MRPSIVDEDMFPYLTNIKLSHIISHSEADAWCEENLVKNSWRAVTLGGPVKSKTGPEKYSNVRYYFFRNVDDFIRFKLMGF